VLGALLLILAAGYAELPPLEPIKGPSNRAIKKSLRRGIDFLMEDQNQDGSWGTPHRTKGLNIYAPVPGAHHAFRAAVTSLCTSALIENAKLDRRIRHAVDRVVPWFETELPKVKRATPAALYNVWAHAYSIQALVRLYRHYSKDPERQEKFKELVRLQMQYLERYELVDGGWAYYDFQYRTRKPGGSSSSFTTATVLIALDEARELGIEMHEKFINRAVASIRRQQKPDLTYLYGDYFRYYPMSVINRPGGSLGRSQACNLAMRRWGDKRITDDVLKEWLARLIVRNGWLSIGRKRPVPHEAWFAVAGYFYYYGHYYAGLCMEELPKKERRIYQPHLARIICDLQEKDGSWWDYPLYNYHQQYGTAFALMTLKRCLK
jgi:hypothetical protein